MSYSSNRKNAIFLLVILVILLSATIYFFFKIRVNPVDNSLKENSIVSSLWILHDEENNVIASEVFVLYPPTKKSVLYDIPGNTGSIYSSLGRVDRIDSVYSQKGVLDFRKEIERLTGRELPFVFDFSIDDFSKLTDIAGGLKIFVPDPIFSKDEAGNYFLFPSGGVTLDGDKIRSYFKYRIDDETESDKSLKDRRQNAFIAFISAFCDNNKMLLNESNFSQFSRYFTGWVNSDRLDEEGLLKVLKVISAIDPDRIASNSITGTKDWVGGKQLLFPEDNGRQVKKILSLTVTSLISEEMSSQSRVYVLEILNGTDRSGLASKTANMFRNAGYEILSFGNAKEEYEYTTIYSHIGNLKSAETIGSFIRCQNIVEDESDASGNSSSIATADFTIILGRDFNGTYATSGYSASKGE